MRGSARCWATFCLIYWGSAGNQMAAGWRPSVLRDKIWAILWYLYNAQKCSFEGNDSNLCVQLRTLSCSPQSLKLMLWLLWEHYMKSCHLSLSPLLFLYLRLYALLCWTLTPVELDHTSASFIICLTDEELHVGCGGTNTCHVLQIISVLYIQKWWNSLTAYKTL